MAGSKSRTNNITHTHVVVAVLDQERNPLSPDVGLASGSEDPIPRPAHVRKDLAVPERPPRETVDDGDGLGVMPGYGVEDGQLRQR